MPVLHDQSILEDFYTVDPALAKTFVTRMLTRDLFAVCGNILVNTVKTARLSLICNADVSIFYAIYCNLFNWFSDHNIRTPVTVVCPVYVVGVFELESVRYIESPRVYRIQEEREGGGSTEEENEKNKQTGGERCTPGKQPSREYDVWATPAALADVAESTWCRQRITERWHVLHRCNVIGKEVVSVHVRDRVTSI